MTRYESRIKSTGTWYGVWDIQDEAWQLGPWSMNGTETSAQHAAAVLNRMADMPRETVETAEFSIEVALPDLPPRPPLFLGVFFMVASAAWILGAVEWLLEGRWGGAILATLSAFTFSVYGIFIVHQRRRWLPQVRQEKRE